MVAFTFTHLALAVSFFTSVFASPVANPDAPDFELGGSNLARRQDYTQNYKTSGNVNFSPTSNGYSVQFSAAQDFVVGKGWNTGSKTRAVTFSGSTSATGGTVLVSLYGWATGPLVEYYVQEYSNGQGAAQGTKVGSLTSDGSEYDIWKHTQVNQPSIQGTTTFTQYISVRKSGRPNGGTITFANHVAAWQKLGMTLGTMNYQTISTEGWGNAAGNSKYTVSGK
ncbi:endo-1,4-beta-xylanase 1 [Colletotrichum spaethianum]|uniref:Endo-1,4-beta-xylanase n=1 Tax=Colletotrichum spaethianum TaxID=700344 RepID=A0AA37LDS3_9PEZI|nr:endo-1,4-beta-xylanase 1 [Colletotrichum spaethianum]GKT44553.1 endo-1,4-beta-xylanase 1 [Colletotrichum spaethianum]